MQNAGLAQLGLNWRYLAFAVQPEHLREAIAGAQRMHYLGLNLTVPHKLLAMGMVDELDASARTWGAVNTIRFEGQDPAGHWRPLREFDAPPALTRSIGFNTDADAIVRSLSEDLGFEPAGKSVVLLGAGGAGRTAALRLAAARVGKLFLVNRTESKAQEIAREIQAEAPGVAAQVGYPEGPVDLLLNATSLGLKSDDALPLDEARFPLRNTRLVYDMIYRPAATPLLARARAAGCQTANGLGMLLYQGAKALEIWTGQPAPILEMKRALQESIYGTV
jgi:shikimate dehydrogenase